MASLAEVETAIWVSSFGLPDVALSRASVLTVGSGHFSCPLEGWLSLLVIFTYSDFQMGADDSVLRCGLVFT